jgi:hypothetical protein
MQVYLHCRLGRSVRYWGHNTFPNQPFLRRALSLLLGTAQQLLSLTTYGTGAFCWYDLASLATDPKVILLYLKLKYAVGHIPVTFHLTIQISSNRHTPILRYVEKEVVRAAK